MAIKKEIELDIKVESIGNLKSQLKAAQREVETLAEKFGATSEQATEAAKKAAQLKDAIGDAKALTDAFNPDAKFNAFGVALQGVAGGFSAVQGAMGLVGVESKDVEATLLKVQSAMALSEGLNSVMAAKDSFTNLAAVIGKTAIGQKLLTAAQIAGAAAMRVLNVVMAANPIMLIVTGVTALVGAFYLLTRSTDKQALAEKELNRQKELSIKLTKIQQEDAENYVKSLQKNSANKIALRKAEGANDEEIYQLEKARLEEQIRYIKLLHDSGVKLTAEQYANQKQAKYDLKILEAQHQTDLKEIRDKAEAERDAKDKERKKQKAEDDAIEAERRAMMAQGEIDADAAAYAYFAEQDRKRAEEKEAARLKELEDAQMYADLHEQIRLKDLQNEKEKEEAKKQLRANQIQGVENTLAMISNLTELFAGKSAKQQERAFKIQKAINIASAVIDTYKAANMALASSPPPFSFIAAGAAITAGLLNVKKIASQQFQGGTASSGGGSSFSGGGSMASSGGGTASNVITPNFNIVGNNGQNQLGQIAPVQAYVVSSEMTTQQALDRNRLRNATF
jgi:hypothetical protein